MKQSVDEDNVVALQIMHHAAHAGEAFAEAQVVGRIILWRFAFRPVPVAAVLNIDDVDIVLAHDWPPGLKSQIIHATDALLENLRRHDCGPNGKDYSAIEAFDRATENPKINSGSASNRSRIEHGMVGNDIVTDARMDGERNSRAKSSSEN